MTTAHRPTYNAAVGGSEQGGNKILVPSRQYSAKELPGQLSMKERPQTDFSKNDFRKELLEKETVYKNVKNAMSTNPNQQKEQLLDIPGFKGGISSSKSEEKNESNDKNSIKFEPTKNDAENENEEKYVNPFPQDADDENFKNDDSNDSSNSE